MILRHRFARWDVGVSTLVGMLHWFAVLAPEMAFAGTVTRITVSAGDLDRADSVVRFRVPHLEPGVYLLSGDGVEVPLQVDKDGLAVMIEPKLEKGGSRTYEVLPASMAQSREKLKATVNGDVLTLEGENGPLLKYQMQAASVPEGTLPIFSHGAHLHPVYSPAGRVVTGNHPPDHPHHRGIWMSWTKTEYGGRSPDFWNMGKDKSGKLTGEVRFGELSQSWSGVVHAGFLSLHEHLDHTSGVEKNVLSEAWQLLVYAPFKDPVARHVFDLVSAQRLVGTEPLTLPKYHYGGLGVRGSREWDEVYAVTMLTSNGDDRVAGDSTKGKWVYMGGKVDGQQTGLVVLIHPRNFRFPQPLRLNPKNPQLSVAPSQEGDWQIGPDENYVSLYRFVVLDGDVDRGLLEKWWLDYANPVSVTVKTGNQ